MKWWFSQNFRALSRLLNAFTGGEGDTTFSAYSWQLATQRTGWMGRWGMWRVWWVDLVMGWITGKPDHCYESWVWHTKHDLFQKDDAL